MALSSRMLKKAASALERLRLRLRLSWIESSLNLNLDLNLLPPVRPCWTAFLSILLLGRLLAERV